jgi:hypothetical protein
MVVKALMTLRAQLRLNCCFVIGRYDYL